MPYYCGTYLVTMVITCSLASRAKNKGLTCICCSKGILLISCPPTETDTLSASLALLAEKRKKNKERFKFS